MNKKKLGIIAVTVLVLSTLTYLYIPIMAQPGDANDPLVTQRYVDDQIARLEEQIAILTHLVTGFPSGHVFTPGTGAGTGMTQQDRDILFAEIMLYFETMYGDMLRAASAIAPGHGLLSPEPVPFEVLNVPPGTTMIFEAGVEFILRAGTGTVIAGPNGIADVTAGRDVGNAQSISQNHLMLVPVTDGRGATFTTDAWIMIRGRYQIVN